MSTRFTLTTNTRVDTFQNNVSVGDVVDYEIDCSPWQEDNDTITSATWNVEYGQASISNTSVTSGVVAAHVTFTQAGRTLLSILLSTAYGIAKKMWIEIYAKDHKQQSDDYGFAE